MRCWPRKANRATGRLSVCLEHLLTGIPTRAAARESLQRVSGEGLEDARGYRNLIPAPNWTPSQILEKGQEISAVVALLAPRLRGARPSAEMALSRLCLARPGRSSPGGRLTHHRLRRPAQPHCDNAVRSQRQGPAITSSIKSSEHFRTFSISVKARNPIRDAGMNSGESVICTHPFPACCC